LIERRRPQEQTRPGAPFFCGFSLSLQSRLQCDPGQLAAEPDGRRFADGQDLTVGGRVGDRLELVGHGQGLLKQNRFQFRPRYEHPFHVCCLLECRESYRHTSSGLELPELRSTPPDRVGVSKVGRKSDTKGVVDGSDGNSDRETKDAPP
jgi:hypothetical protein